MNGRDFVKRCTAALVLSMCVLATGRTQTIAVGKGSYATTLPVGAVGPQTSTGANILPKISSAFQKPAQSNDFWSSLIYPFYGDAYSNNMYAHPLNLRAKAGGLQVGYTVTPVFAAQDYLFPYSQQLTLGVAGLNAPKAVADDYGDWTATALWDDGTRTMRATFGHGLPFVFVTISGGNVSITCNTVPTIWSNANGVVGLTVDGRHYGIFAPDSSVWTGTTVLQSTLNGKNFFSVALLPDNTVLTLEFYRLRAYAFVTGSSVAWHYDQPSAKMTSTFTYTTQLMDSSRGQLPHTLTALYRHQYINSANPLTAYSYVSTAGTMKVFDGNSFTTELTFEGVLPALPDQGDYNRADLLAMVNAVTAETLPESGTQAGTYWSGKKMARFAHLVNIADQLGAVTARDYFLAQIKKRLEEWFTAGGPQEYVYNSSWKTMTGYPAEFGTDNQINDHNFHAGYAIMAAAIVAQYDSVWASNDNWGGMVDLLIRDGNSYDRSDTRFPFLRAFDPYAGHSWEAGHGDFGDGNNEESSSESMNFATAVTLWGAATRQNAVRDLGIYLYTTERTAIEQYWFNVDHTVFPSAYPYKALGMVWGGKGVHSTWFGANPDYIHGINWLPFNGGSLYLGRRPEYVRANYDEMTTELSGSAPTWKDITWHYLALIDPGTALSLFYANSSYTPEEGESKAHTLHWLSNLKKMGQLDLTVTADIPTYAVLKNAAGDKTYTAYNPAPDSTTVHFSDGYSLKIPPHLTRSVSTAPSNPDAPVAMLLADRTGGKSPLTVTFSGSKSFDRNNSPISFAWNFGDGTGSAKSDTIHQFANPGKYTVVLTVTNQIPLSTSDSVVITVAGNGTPYSGTAVMVPATFQAVDYDNGGEGVAYHDNDTKNVGLAYRPNEGVDIEPSTGGTFDVYWITAGEWLEYTIQFPADGNYDIIASVATVPGFGNFRLFLNNVDISGKKAVTGTGGWQSWVPIATLNVPVKAGKQVLHIEFNTDTPSEKSNWLFSLKTFQVKVSNPAGVADAKAVPAAFLLEQNYPNPFNPSTEFRFTVAKSGPATLTLYNVLGQKIATLFDGAAEAGRYYTARFDAKGFASGMYYARLQSGAESRMRKVVLTK